LNGTFAEKTLARAEGKRKNLEPQLIH
jgi:hypothetical protein